MFKKIFLFVTIFCVFSISAQTQVVLTDADYSREVNFEWESGDYINSNSLDAKPTTTKSTFDKYGPARRFVFLQWSLPDALIPDGSTITYVELSWNYYATNSQYKMHTLFYDDKDIADPNFSYVNYSALFNGTTGKFVDKDLVFQEKRG